MARSAAGLWQPHSERGVEPGRSGRLAALTAHWVPGSAADTRAVLPGSARQLWGCHKLETRFLGHFRRFCPISLSCRRVASCPSRHARVRRCPAGSDTLAAELLRRRHVICRCRALLRLGWRRHRAACAFGAAATRADTRLPFFAKGAVASCYDGRGPSQAFTMHLRIETACAAGLCGPA